MKKFFYILSALLLLATACQKDYVLNTDFEMPTTLSSPSAVTLDVTSSSTVELAWQGGGAADGGIVLYEVLFDREGGDFSDPILVLPSDLGANPQLTLSHATLNTIARKAGVKPNETGTFIWTVRGSKGGVTKTYSGYETLRVTRGEGIDNIPEHLYIAGSGAREAGQEFRIAEEGLYIIYTQVGAGELKMTSEPGGGFTFYADANGKLNEGDGGYTLENVPTGGLARITVNFNTLAFRVEEIDPQVRCIWAATYADIAILEYQGNGKFVGDGDVVFYGPGREGTPSWCSWVEERYYFIAKVGGEEVCWGSSFGGNAITPDGTAEFFHIYEFPWSQWDNLWKMDHAYDLSHLTFTIDTNKDNTWTHSYQGGAIQYDQPTEAPADLALYGAGAEAEGQPFRKASDGVFVLYAKLKGGAVSFRASNGTKYFADSEKKLFIGNRSYDAPASEEVTRVTVDFNTNLISFDEIGTDVRLIWGATYADIAVLSYQGQGKWAGEGHVLFIDPSRPETNPPSWLGWTEERYYFIAKVNGAELCWGRLDNESAERPDGEVTETFYDLGEFAWSQWDHLWKMASALDNTDVSVSINTNDEGHMRHSFTVLTPDPFPPTVAPSALTIHGSGAEVQGQAFRKTGDGVFQVYARLKDGAISFQGDGKTYFLDAEKGLLQGIGEGASVASGDNVTRITVDFQALTVKTEAINKVRMIWGATFGDIVTMDYAGEGNWSGTGTPLFVDPANPATNPPSWLSWVEERYYFVVTIDGEERLCWGRLDGVNGEYRPDDARFENDPKFYDCGEFGWSQWDHLWKMSGEMNGANVEVTLFTNKDGVMTHTITKK